MRNEGAVALYLLACVALNTTTDSKRKKRIQGFLEEAESDLDAGELKDSGAWHEPPQPGSVARTADGNLDLEPLELDQGAEPVVSGSTKHESARDQIGEGKLPTDPLR